MKSLIYIDRNNLYFYGGNVHAPLVLPFKPTTIRDIEIINSEQFEKELNDFIKNNKIEPTDTMIIIAHQSSFEKILDPKTPSDQIEILKKQFIDNVPFEEVLSKSFITPKGTKIIVVNKDLIYLIRDIFTRNHFNVEVIASIAALFPDSDITLNATSAQQILQKASAFKQYMFLLKDEDIPSTDMFEETYVKTKKNNTLLYSIPAFVILIGILVWLIISQRTAAKLSTKKITPIPAQVSARISPTLTIEPSQSIATETLLPKDSISIRVLNGSGIVGQADTVKDALEKNDYTLISTGNASTLQTARTLIIVKSKVPSVQREEIANIIKPVVGDASIQVNDEIDVDVFITTAKSTTEESAQ